MLHCATLACAQDWAAGTPQTLIWTILVPLLHGSRQHEVLGPGVPAAAVWAACEHSIFKITMHCLAAGGKALLMQLFASINIINNDSNAFQLMMMFDHLQALNT